MMTVEQLKSSILQLAMQGKLVSQDVLDEPAQELLERVRRKKRELIKAKKVPKDKKVDAVSEDEQLFDIPESWVWTRVGELFQHNTGKALNGSNKEGTVLPYITTSNLYWNRFELDKLKEMPFTDSELEKCTAKKGDLLVCEGGDYGRAAIWSYDYDIRIQNHVHKLRPYETLCIEYFYYVFYYLKNTGQIHGKGIAIQGLSSGTLHNLAVPLPPLNEQYRIVDKIHSIIPFWEQYAAASTKLNTLNTSFPDMMKKSILQEAIQGKLVPQDSNDEPAGALLKKIAEVKKRLIKEGKIRKQKSLPEITEDEIPFDIPDSWEWVRLGTITEQISDGTHRTPRYVDSGVPFLSVQNISGGFFNLTNVKYIEREEHEELIKRCKPIKDDILVCRIGTLGKAIKVTVDFEFSIFVSLGLIRLLDYRIDDYIINVINSGYGKQWIDKVKVGGGTHTNKINLKSFPEFLIPLPPLAEQKRIVAKIEDLMSGINELIRYNK